jgi:phosphate transport system substrate-binding protein
MTAGHAVIGAADAAHKIAWKLSAAFQAGQPAAFVDIVAAPATALLDSLLQERREEIILDRAPSPAETLAFHQARLRLLQYPLAYHPVYLLKRRDNPVAALDSAELRAVLLGETRDWSELGGPLAPIHVYVPDLGGGAVRGLLAYFGGLPSLTATVAPTADSLLALARGDEGALLVWDRPLPGPALQALLFGPRGAALFPDAGTIMGQPRYPFRLELTYLTTRNKADVAAGFLTFMTSNTGQREFMNNGYRPAAVPVRIVRLTHGETPVAEK